MSLQLGKQLKINIPLELIQTKIDGCQGCITTTITYQKGVKLKFIVNESGAIQVESNKRIVLNNNTLNIIL